MVDYGSHFQAVARRPLCYATGFVGVRPPRQSLHLAGAGGVPRLNSFFHILNKKGIKNSVLFFIRPPWSDSSGRPGGHQEAAHMCVDFKQGRQASRRAEPGWAVHPNRYQTSKMWVNDHIAVLQRKTGRSDPDQLHPSSAMHCPAASWWLA